MRALTNQELCHVTGGWDIDLKVSGLAIMGFGTLAYLAYLHPGLAATTVFSFYVFAGFGGLLLFGNQ